MNFVFIIMMSFDDIFHSFIFPLASKLDTKQESTHIYMDSMPIKMCKFVTNYAKLRS